MRHLDRLHRVARTLCGSAHEAEDLVQDTCVQLLGRRREIRGDDELAYLLTALRNTHVSRRRAAARRPRAVELADAPEHALADRQPGADTVEQVGAREVLRWISALPEEIRVAVTAVDVAGLSRADAGLALGISERRVSERLARGHVSLAARLDPVRGPARDQRSGWVQGRRHGMPARAWRSP